MEKISILQFGSKEAIAAEAIRLALHLMLARAVNDEPLAEQILKGTAKRVGGLANGRKRVYRSSQ